VLSSNPDPDTECGPLISQTNQLHSTYPHMPSSLPAIIHPPTLICQNGRGKDPAKLMVYTISLCV